MPPTPPSLVRLAASVTSETTGAATSSPISDHVPDERYAVVGPASGAPTTADAVSWEPGATTRAPRRPVSAARSERRSPSTVPGCTISGRNPVGMPRRSSSGRAQSRVNGIQALARAGVRVLGDGGPTQEVGEQVAHHQQPVGLGQLRVSRARHRQQLEERVDGHELDSRRAVDLLARDGREGQLGHARRARVAVVDRVAEQPAARVEKAEVHAPGVDADRCHGAAGGRPAQARGDVAEQAQKVPVERAGKGHRDVLEAVDVLHRQAPAVEGARPRPGRSRRPGRRPPGGASDQSRRNTSSRRRWKPVCGSVHGSMSDAMSACQRALTGDASIMARNRSKSSHLEDAEQVVVAQVDRVVAAAGRAQRVEHLRPDGRVPPPVLRLRPGQELHREGDPFHGGSSESQGPGSAASGALTRVCRRRGSSDGARS